MRIIIVLFAVIAITVGDIFDEKSAKYIQDPELYSVLYKCVMDYAPCPQEFQEYRDDLPRYLHNRCADCSLEQKRAYMRYDKMVHDLYPNLYRDIYTKYASKDILNQVLNMEINTINPN